MRSFKASFTFLQLHFFELLLVGQVGKRREAVNALVEVEVFRDQLLQGVRGGKSRGI
jgi:hypothetical protein